MSVDALDRPARLCATPTVGRKSIEIADAPDQRLFVYRPPENGPSPDAVALLESLTTETAPA